MKLFFASDIHGSLATTKAMLEKYQQSQADFLILLGDLLNHGPRNPLPEEYNPAAVAELLNQHKEKIIAVRGNCDSEVDQMLLEFPVLSDYHIVLLPSKQRLFLTHGHIYNEQRHPQLSQNDILAYGHTHLPVAKYVSTEASNNKEQQAMFYFNPGSISIPKGGNPASYGLLDGNLLRVMSFDNEVLCEQIIY